MTYQTKPSYNKSKPTAGINRWNFSGAVLKKTSKYTTNGNLIVSVMIKVPAQNPKYSTVLWLKAFNGKTPDKNLAEQLEKSVKEGSNYAFYGYVSTSSFEKEGVKQYRTDFVVNRFEEADEQVKQEETQDVNKDVKDKVPF